MLTLARKDPLRLAKWPEFDLENGEWKIPAHRMNGGSAHRVPVEAGDAVHRR